MRSWRENTVLRSTTGTGWVNDEEARKEREKGEGMKRKENEKPEHGGMKGKK